MLALQRLIRQLRDNTVVGETPGVTEIIELEVRDKKTNRLKDKRIIKNGMEVKEEYDDNK